MPQEAHAKIRRILILTTLAIAQALSAAGDNHSRTFLSRTLSKHCYMKEYMDAFLFMDFFFFFFFGQCTISCQDQYQHYFKVLALFTIGLTCPCMLKGHPDYLLLVDVEQLRYQRQFDAIRSSCKNTQDPDFDNLGNSPSPIRLRQQSLTSLLLSHAIKTLRCEGVHGHVFIHRLIFYLFFFVSVLSHVKTSITI